MIVIVRKRRDYNSDEDNLLIHNSWEKNTLTQAWINDMDKFYILLQYK